MVSMFPNSAGYLPPPFAVQKLYDYAAGTSIIYEGWAPSGASINDAVWCIKKYTYSGSQMTAETWASVPAVAAPDALPKLPWTCIWANRAALTYA